MRPDALIQFSDDPVGLPMRLSLDSQAFAQETPRRSERDTELDTPDNTLDAALADICDLSVSAVPMEIH